MASTSTQVESSHPDSRDHDAEENAFDPDEHELISELARHSGNDGYTYEENSALNAYNDHDHDHDHATGGHAQFPNLDELLAYASRPASGRGANLPSDQITHRSTALPQGHEHESHDHGLNAAELEPAALLESLANFDHSSSNENNELSISNADFASLLRAAASATGDEAYSGRAGNSNEHAFETGDRNGGSKHAHDEDRSYEARVPRSFLRNHSKRGLSRKGPVDEEQMAKEREYWGTGVDRLLEDEHNGEYMGHRVGAEEARAAGVHSAVALFRRPSSASRKYTRPPMSKLFTSVELEPERFLELQGAAKSYMLDPNFPERSDCVGNRGKGDADMTKLKLFGCVKGFLEDEGWGEKCWGEDTDPYHDRKLHWPADKNRIIALVTPLLRRMVTNERQRQYAVVTRKEAATAAPPKKKLKRTHETDNVEPSPEDPTPPRGPSPPLPVTRLQISPRQPTPQVYPDYPTGSDTNHNNHSEQPQTFSVDSTDVPQEIDSDFHPPHAEATPKRKRGRPPKRQKTTHELHDPRDPFSLEQAHSPFLPQPGYPLDHFYHDDNAIEEEDNNNNEPKMYYHVSVINPSHRSGQSRVRAPLVLNHVTCPGFPSLVQHVHNLLASPPYLSARTRRRLNAANNTQSAVANTQPQQGDKERTPTPASSNNNNTNSVNASPAPVAPPAAAEEDEQRLHLQRISVLLPTGLTAIDSEEGWQFALEEIVGCEWMDGNVRVLVEVEVVPEVGDETQGQANVVDVIGDDSEVESASEKETGLDGDGIAHEDKAHDGDEVAAQNEGEVEGEAEVEAQTEQAAVTGDEE